MEKKALEADFQAILDLRHQNGADFWATPDGRLGIDQPISTLTALLIMSELMVDPDHEALRGAQALVLHAVGEDGRIHIAPKGSVYPCQIAIAAAALARTGCLFDPPTGRLLAYLLANRHSDGGWRCNKFLFGHGPETEHSNPGVTLFALEALRLAGYANDPELEPAVETLLHHWEVRLPTGPCHYGMGTLFMQTEFPFLRYNLFFYTYVLSFYPKARSDPRFREAFDALSGKLNDAGRIIIERPSRKLAHLSICRRGEPSEAATARFREILRNLELPSDLNPV